ncbi:MAG: hypothetical protein AB7Q42_10620 [Acidimicrobiia bacterium]
MNGGFADETITVSGGRGDDDFQGGDGAELFIGNQGDDTVDGNRGADQALLGSGHDTFRWDPGDGSDVIEGQAGFDTLDFNGAAVDEKMSLSANGARTLFFRDAGNISMDMDGVERLDLTTLGGIDTFTVGALSGTDVRVTDVDLSGPAGGGDGQADTVTVNGSAKRDKIDVDADDARVEVEDRRDEVRIIGSEPIDLLQVNGLEGNDEVDVDDDVAALITVAVDLGADQH